MRCRAIIVGEAAHMLQPVFEVPWKSELVTCNSTNKVFHLPPPTTCIIDVRPFLLPMSLDLTAHAALLRLCDPRHRAHLGQRVRCVCVCLSSALATFMHYDGPEARYGFGDLAMRLDAAGALKGMTEPKIADSVFRQVGGGVIKLSGVPGMYDYEFFPQEVRRRSP
jgi:hypothetical protein